MPQRPWIRRLRGETVQQMNARLNKTCLWCGDTFDTVAVTNAHEDGCSSHNPPGRKPS